MKKERQQPTIWYTYPQLLIQNAAPSPGSNFNRRGGSIFNRREQVLFIASVTVGWHAVTLFRLGKQFTVSEYLGFSLILLGGCFDPINFVWLCLPFTRNQIAISPKRFALAGALFSGIGFLLFAVGWIVKHWLP